MAGNYINSGAINAGDTGSQIVYLPDGLSTKTIILYERSSQYMNAEITFGRDASGDLSKIVTFVADPIEISKVVTGDLNLSKTIYLSGDVQIDKVMTGSLGTIKYIQSNTVEKDITVTGDLSVLRLMEGSIDLSRELTGSLINVSNLGAGSSTTVITASGALTVQQVMEGSSTKTLEATGSILKTQHLFADPVQIAREATGDLTITYPNYISPGLALVEMGKEVTGYLSGTFYFQAESQKQLNATGALTAVLMLDGAVETGFSITGDLSNNAYAADLAASTMYRPKRNREMVR